MPQWNKDLTPVAHSGMLTGEGKNTSMTNADPLNPERWVDEHGDILYRYALTRVHDASTAQDMVQETFLAAVKGAESYSGKSSERTWLVGILKHKIIDFIRKASREQTYEDPEMPADRDEIADLYFDRKGHWKVAPPDWQTHPRKQFEQQEFHEVLLRCLNALKDRMRDAFMLRELEGLNADEICKQLDISSTNLWVILYRARMQLKGCLESTWLNEGEQTTEDHA